MTKKEQTILDARLGKWVREFLEVNKHHCVDTFETSFPTPTIENYNATSPRRVRLSRKADGTIELDYIVAWN
jgi:hypothetical protein